MHSREFLNMSVGQTELHPVIREELAKPLPTPTYFQEYRDIQERTLKALQQIMGTSRDVFVLLGLARTGLETGAYHLINEGDVVISIDTGHWGKYYGEIAKGLGADVEYLSAPLGESAPMESFASALKSRHVHAITLTHCETNTGVVNPVAEIAAVRDELSPDTLILVDGVSMFGGAEVKFDEWGIDFYCGGSQKCLNAPQGTPIVCFSERGLERSRRKSSSLKTFALECKPSFLLMRGLDAISATLLDEGLHNVYHRHAIAAEAIRAGVRALGLGVFANSDSIASPSCTRISFPPRLSGLIEDDRTKGTIDSDRLTQTMKEKCGVVIGEDRIGTLGHFARQTYVLGALGALEEAMNLLEWRKSDGAGVSAAQQVYAGCPSNLASV